MMLKTLPLALLFTAAAALAEPGSVARNTELKDKPFLDAKTTAKLAAGSPVDIINRQGAWIQLKTREGQTGWAKLLNIRSSNTSQGVSILGAVTKVASIAKTGSSGNTVTTGVKGLSEEQIRNAKANPEEVERMYEYSVSETDARKYASQNKLVAQKIADIAVK